MIDWFRELGPVLQAFVAGLFTWSVTALGAGLVFVARRVHRRLLDSMLGFAAGVMMAASVWSLLLPSIELASVQGRPGWLPATVGFLLGGLFLRVADQLLPHLHPLLALEQAEGVRTAGSDPPCWSWRSRCTTYPRDWPWVSLSAPPRASSTFLRPRPSPVR